MLSLAWPKEITLSCFYCILNLIVNNLLVFKFLLFKLIILDSLLFDFHTPDPWASLDIFYRGGQNFPGRGGGWWGGYKVSKRYYFYGKRRKTYYFPLPIGVAGGGGGGKPSFADAHITVILNRGAVKRCQWCRQILYLHLGIKVLPLKVPQIAIFSQVRVPHSGTK